tara:strand:- start:3358 stop:3633 length:276 start_codon:yes stop_codon:yes gene_type:complete
MKPQSGGAYIPSFCGFVRAYAFLCPSPNRTVKLRFVFCDLYPETADFLHSRIISLAASVTFQLAHHFIHIVKEPVPRPRRSYGDDKLWGRV